SETVADAMASLAQYKDLTGDSVLLVHCGDGLWYAARYEELEAISAKTDGADASLSLEARLGKERTPMLFPDLPLSSTLPHFKRWPLLPVTNRAMRGALEGAVSMTDVLKRYQGHS